MSIAPLTIKSTIADHVQHCLRGFRAIEADSQSSEAPNLPAAFTIENELGRFKLWCGNIGAHQRGKSSLDHKLREASHIRIRVIELLQRLRNTLSDISSIVSGDRTPWDAQSSSDSDDTELYDEGSEEETEIQQLAVSLADLVTNLMQLSSSIRNPAAHDQFILSKDTTTASHFERFDIEHVTNKYPQIEQWLAERLGSAITRRWQYVHYREGHQKRLAQGLDVADASAIEVGSTVASSIPTRLKTGTSALHDDEAESFDYRASVTSFASSISGTLLRPPPLPREGREGRPFECPVCHCFMIMDTDLAWYSHVYRDLQPYMSVLE